MLLFSLAIAPGIAICLYIFLKDQYNREPRRHLVISFLLGIVSGLIAGALEMPLVALHGKIPLPDIVSTAVLAYAIIALTEESSKYMMVRYYAFPQPEFDEPYDGIVYTVMVGMGFATIENIAYVREYGYAAAWARMLLSVPGHGTFAVMMGYNLGKAWMNQDKRVKYMMLGLFWAVFFHGTFDFLLLLGKDQLARRYVPEQLLFLGAVISFGIAIGLSRKAIKEHVALSRELAPIRRKKRTAKTPRPR